MFVVKDRYEFTAPVAVHVPTEDGKHVEQAFKASFLMLTTDQIAKLYEGKTVDDGDAAVLRASLLGWFDMVDAKNKPVPFSEEMRDRLIGIPFVRQALRKALIRSIGGEPAAA